MVLRQQDLQRRQVLKYAGAAAGLLTVGGGITVFLISQTERSEPKPKYLSCQEVNRLLKDYSDNKLDSDLMARVAAHLNRCPPCFARYEQNLQLAQSGSRSV